MANSTQLFNVSSIPSIQELLLSMAEYVTLNITATSIVNQQGVLQAIQQTLFNIIDILNAYQFQTLGLQEFSLLNNVTSILNLLSANDRAFITARLNSFTIFNSTVFPLPLSLPVNINNLTNGTPALQAYDLTSYLINFNSEISPVALTLSNFSTEVQAMATAWADALAILGMSGTSLFQATAYDPTDRMATCSQDVANFITNLTLASNLTPTQLNKIWNSLITIPSILRVIALIYNDPSSAQSQYINVLKFVIFNLIYQTNSILATFNIPNNLVQPTTATLRASESLLDFANRTTGNYTQWTAIAAANNLIPPYVGVVPAQGIATPGQRLFLPPFSVNSPIANYNDFFLGTDIDLGLPNTQLLEWTGDFTLIKGLNNYIGALIRRVLTLSGTLIYHSTYGSLLPSEVGSVTTASEAKLSSGYLKGALLQDPRTQTVDQIVAYPVKFGQIVLAALVTPYGNTSPVPLSLIITPPGSSNVVS